MEQTRRLATAQDGGQEEKGREEQGKAGNGKQDEAYRHDPVHDADIDRMPLERADGLVSGGHGYSLPLDHLARLLLILRRIRLVPAAT